LWYLLITKSSRTASKGFGKFLLTVGLIRTVACGGWVYITSSDDHDTHDIAMILYLLCTLPWQVGVWKTTPRSSRVAAKWRKIFTGLFFGTLPPMIYYFIQHKVHRVAGGKENLEKTKEREEGKKLAQSNNQRTQLSFP
jgi:hypothetical protein